MTTEQRFKLAKIAFEIHTTCSTIEDTELTVRDARQLESLYPCLRKKRFERLQQVSLETGAMILLEYEEYCVNCGASEPHFHMIESKLHCNGIPLPKPTRSFTEGLTALSRALSMRFPNAIGRNWRGVSKWASVENRVQRVSIGIVNP